MVRTRSRKSRTEPHPCKLLSARLLPCPYCTKPEKWCKNLSGLTQHINTVHIDIVRAPSPPPSESLDIDIDDYDHQEPGLRSDSSANEDLDRYPRKDPHPTLYGEYIN